MDFEKISEAIKKSSNQVKNLIFSDRLGGVIQDIAWENGLDEDTALKLGDEIGYIILDLKPKINLENFLVQIGIEKENIKDILDQINIKIFSQIDIFNTNIDDKKVFNDLKIQISKKDTPSNLIGQSFENVILNQAKAMMPALEEGEEVREVDSSEQLVDSREDSDYIEIREKRDRAVAPSNLPTEKIETNKIDVPNYAGGDPYREPLE